MMNFACHECRCVCAQVFIREPLVDWSRGDAEGGDRETSTKVRLRVARSKLNLANPVEILRCEIGGAWRVSGFVREPCVCVGVGGGGGARAREGTCGSGFGGRA